jgi:hypothetical protein
MEYEDNVQEDKRMFDFPSGAQTCFAVDSKSEVWGVGIKGVDNNFFITKFRNHTRQTVYDLKIEKLKLHLELGADIQFLHTVMGIKTCSARYCCAKCLVTLKDLREERSFECFPGRTRHSFNQALVNVHEGATWDDKRQLAQTNESVMREPLIPIDFSRVMLAVLHVIIGITMYLYMNLVSDIQEVESEYLAERRMLSEARENLTLYIAKGHKEREKVKQHLKNV